MVDNKRRDKIMSSEFLVRDPLVKNLFISRESNKVRVRLLTHTSEIVFFDEVCDIFHINSNYKKALKMDIQFNGTDDLFCKIKLQCMFALTTEKNADNKVCIILESYYQK